MVGRFAAWPLADEEGVWADGRRELLSDHQKVSGPHTLTAGDLICGKQLGCGLHHRIVWLGGLDRRDRGIDQLSTPRHEPLALGRWISAVIESIRASKRRGRTGWSHDLRRMHCPLIGMAGSAA